MHCMDQVSPQSIDFSLLHKPVTAQDIDNYRRNAGKWLSFSTLKLLLSGVCLAAVVGIGVQVAGGPRFLLPGVIMTVIAAAGLATYVLSVWMATKRHVRTELFAKQHGFGYEATGRQTLTGNGMLFQAGWGGRWHDVIYKAARQHRLFEVGTYEYSAKTDITRDNRYTWYYACVALERKLPHIVLDAKANDLGLFGSNLPSELKVNQEVQLEGDFQRYFTVYAPRQYDIDVRYILTPDVMALLVDESAAVDVEIIDDRLYFYIRSLRMTHRAAMERLVRLSMLVGQKIYRQTDYYVDDRMAGARQVNAVHTAGRRLQRSVTRMMALTAVIGGLYIIVMLLL